jgi:single-strand DNA-binding protein
MAGVNKVILIGNVGKDPVMRFLEGGTAIAEFSLATNESYKDKTGKRIEHTEWHRVILWRGLAEIAEKFLKKGAHVYIEGRLRTRAWEDKEKIKHYSTEIIGDQLVLLDKKEIDSTENNRTDELSS